MDDLLVFEQLLFSVRSLNVYVCVLIGLLIWFIFQSSISGR